MASEQTKKSITRIIVVALILIILVILTAGLLIFFMPNGSAETSAPVSAVTDTAAPQQLIIPEGLPASDNLPYSVTVAVGSTWEDGGMSCTQLDITVSNNGTTTVSDWKYSFDVPEGASVKQSWNASYSIDGTVLTVSADGAEIAPGGSVSTGVIISSPAPISSVTTQSPAETQSGSTSAPENLPSAPADTVKAVVPEAVLERSEGAVQGDDWLYVKGNKIVDKDGKEVWLTGCNWFGYNTGTNIFDGIWNSNLENSVSSIADHGFNVIRVPFSAELINQWSAGTYPTANYNQALNPNLANKNSLEIFDYVVELCEANGIKIIIDVHCAKTDAMGHMSPLWYSDGYTTEQYYHALEWMAARYKNNDTIIAYDLKNEPHGKPNEGLSNMAIWNNSTSANNWKYTAEVAAQRVLAQNPNVLILVEGTEAYPKDIKSNNFTSTNNGDYNITWWGGNLRGVKDYPINLGKYQNKLVYSPHDYGPTVYKQPWFDKNYTFDTLMADCWRDNWFYIYENKTAPLLIGEWGGFMTEPNITWMTNMRRLIKENRLHHTFWCFNANSGDTGGLVKDDFVTWDTEKYNFVKEVLWQENGKFVGLDHEIPLGQNGICVSDVK